MRPKVSVIVPVFGVEKYIERCAVSLFEQTLQEIEYIFIDDCSPDKSIELLELTLEKYPNRRKWTRIIRLSTNSGPAKVRKRGIMEATGDYIIHCDSDDWTELDMYEKLYTSAVDNQVDIAFCGYCHSIDLNTHSPIKEDVVLVKEELLKRLLSHTLHSTLCNKLVRSSLYRNKILYPEGNINEDLVLSVQLVYYASSFSFLPEPLYHYFYNPSSITKKCVDAEKAFKRNMQALSNFKLMDDFLLSVNMYALLRKEIISNHFRMKIATNYLISSKQGRKEWMSMFTDCTLLNLLGSNLSLKAKLFYIKLLLCSYL